MVEGPDRGGPYRPPARLLPGRGRRGRALLALPRGPLWRSGPPAAVVDARGVRVTVPYAELQTTSNFSFLRGASHPHELVVGAAALEMAAIGICDRNSLAGVVRAWR